MKGPTARQTEAWEALQRHGGHETHGAAARASEELGLTPGAFASAVSGYERHVTAEGASPRLTARQTVASIPTRLEAVERQLANVLALQGALALQVEQLGDEIRRWTARQPVYVEMRPRHDRVADGGRGGRREAKQLRRIASDDDEAIA